MKKIVKLDGLQLKTRDSQSYELNKAKAKYYCLEMVTLI